MSFTWPPRVCAWINVSTKHSRKTKNTRNCIIVVRTSVGAVEAPRRVASAVEGGVVWVRDPHAYASDINAEKNIGNN